MKHERLGLWMIAASLTVIVGVTALFARWQRDVRQEQARVQGVSLVTLLARLPYDELVPSDGLPGPLQLVRHSQGNPDFAYAAVVDVAGNGLLEVTAPGLRVPPLQPGDEPSSWLGENLFPAEPGRDPIREFVAPVLRGSERVAHVRVGFFDAGYATVLQQAPFLGSLALLIFLLTPLAYLLLRRELGSFREASDRVRAALDPSELERIQLRASGGMAELAETFNHFVETTRARLEELRDENSGMLASSRVLAYQKARIESVIETLPEAALVLDEAGAVIFANSKLESFLGVAREDVLGLPAVHWCKNEELLSFLAQYQGSTARLHRSDAMEFSPDPATPQRLVVSAHPLVPVRPGPEIPGILVVLRDVTAETISRTSQSEFISHVAHELKSPLNVLSMYSEMLIGKDADSEELRLEACNVIHDEVDRLSGMISTLLNIGRIEAGEVTLDRQRTRTIDFLRDVVEAASRVNRDSELQVAAELPAEMSVVFLDKDLLRVAINNLLTNAIKYNRVGGEVALAAEETEQAVLIHVRDSGIGIGPEAQARVFDKFYRSDDPDASRRPGHGLGLTLARQIVELHGGRLGLESVLGEGSTFTIELPKTSTLMREPT